MLDNICEYMGNQNPTKIFSEKPRVGTTGISHKSINCHLLFYPDTFPTLGPFLDVVWKILELHKSGIYNVAGSEEVTRFELACMTAEVFGFDKERIHPVPNSFFNGIAPRPRNTTYCIDKIKRDLGVYPDGIREGLMKMKELWNEKA